MCYFLDPKSEVVLVFTVFAYMLTKLCKSSLFGCSNQAPIPLCCANRIFVGIPPTVLWSRLRREMAEWTRQCAATMKGDEKVSKLTPAAKFGPSSSPLHLVYWENDIFKRTFTPCKTYFVFCRTSPFLANIRAPKTNF